MELLFFLARVEVDLPWNAPLSIVLMEFEWKFIDIKG